jgi:hypothetical protein
MAVIAGLVGLLASTSLHAQMAVKAGPRGTAVTSARASAPVAVSVSRPVETPPGPKPGIHHPHDRFPRGYLPYGYFPTFAATRTVVVEPTVTYIDNTVVHDHEYEEVVEDAYSEAPGAKRLVWRPGGITPVTPVPYVPVNAPLLADADLGVLESGPHFRRFGALWFSGPGCEETQTRQRPDRRRLPWGLGWLQRYGRDVEVERGGVAPPSLYLRSPLLSGLYRRPDCPREQIEVEESCALVTLVADDDSAMTIEVPLPQLNAISARQLRDMIRAAIEEGETVVLATTDGEEFDLMPGSVRQVDAVACRVE